MSETVTCPNCGSEVTGGTGFGVVECSKCGEFVLLGSDQPQPAIREAAPEPKTTVLDISLIQQGSETNVIPFPEPEPSEAVPETPLPASPFQDVVDFGNQELPSSGFGGLVYDVTISGIDTAEIRSDLTDCLNDRRLQLDVNETLAHVKNGELVLEKLNPVKASVLLNRVRHFPFKISWSSRQMIKGVQTLLWLFLIPFLLCVGGRARADDYARHEANLQGYATKIFNMQEDIRALIKKKNLEKDPEKRDALLKDIVAKHEELMKIYDDFKKEKEHVLFEDPEQGDKTERKYRHVKMKSLEELEKEPGLDGQLTRLKIKVEETYPSPSPTAVGH